MIYFFIYFLKVRVKSKTGAKLIQLNPDAGLNVNELPNVGESKLGSY